MSDHDPFLVGLRLSGRPVCAVGDLPDLVRRARDLHAAGAAVLVVSDDDDVCAEIEAQGLSVVSRAWRPADFTGRIVAVVCLAEGYEEAARAARTAGCLVYVPDVPHASDFVLPAIVHRGHLQVAVSTAGRSPAAARRLAARLDSDLPGTTEATIDAMASARAELKSSPRSFPTYAEWARALDAGLDAPDDGAAVDAVRRAIGLDT